MGKRRTYTKEFKLEAIRLAEERGNISAVARNLGLHGGQIQRWKKRYELDGEKAFPGQGRAKDEEFDRLQRELKRVKEENAILKKAVGIFVVQPR